MLNSKNKKILLVFGTRPEAIKMAPLVHSLSLETSCRVKVCVTGQHDEMLKNVLDLFEITADYNLNVMHDAAGLHDLLTLIIQRVAKIIEEFRPDIIVVHGDTTSTLAAALAAYYSQVDVAHVEAGLRTNNIYSPWPEEGNRVLVSKVSNLHFAPTTQAQDKLLKEGIDPKAIFVTGNTVIDALKMVLEKINNSPTILTELNEKFATYLANEKVVLITAHRRENFGKGFESICGALAELARKFQNVNFVFPVHLNPTVRNPVHHILGNIPNIFLIEPVQYNEFVYLMKASDLILTDSGGIQEEAPSLGTPVLVMRDRTERPEAVTAGTVKIVGSDKARIVKEVTQLFTNEKLYTEMRVAKNPYGDGNAAEIITKCIVDKLTSF